MLTESMIVLGALFMAQLPPDWQGVRPEVGDYFGAIPEQFQRYEVVLKPDASAPEWWAGAPSVVRDADGVFWLACRMRTAEGPRGLRGYEVRILRSDNGAAFETVHSIKREDVPIPGFERPSLLIDPHTNKFKLYGCGPWQEGPWSIIKFDDADRPDLFRADTARPVVQTRPPSHEYDLPPAEYKDPVVVWAEGRYHMYVIGVIRRTERIFHFTSVDGESWQAEGNLYEPIMHLQDWHNFYVRPASVLPLGMGYLFVYEGSRVSWFEPYYNIAAGLGFTFDLHTIIDLTPQSPLITSSTPNDCFHTWRYSHWMWVEDEIWVYAEVAAPDKTHEIRLFKLQPQKRP